MGVEYLRGDSNVWKYSFGSEGGCSMMNDTETVFPALFFGAGYC